MRIRILLLLGASIVLLAQGCTPAITKDNVQNIHRVGVVNTFPDYAGFIHIGTTVFNNQLDTVSDPSYRKLVTEIVDSYLEEHGYEVKHFSKAPTAAEFDVDVLLEVSPQASELMAHATGCGFYQRSAFGIKHRPTSFAILGITHYFSPNTAFKYGTSAAAKTPLPVANLPNSWAELTDQQKVELREILLQDLRVALTEALEDTGLDKKSK